MSPPAHAAALRREQNRADARRAILDAAETLLVESGHRGFAVRPLVERCGYSAPTIYHYFGDKPGLIEALLEERLQELVEELEQVPSGNEPIAQARVLCLAFARWGIRHPAHYHLMNEPRDREPSPGSAAYRAVELMSDPLVVLAEGDEVDEERLTLIRQSLWACLHGLISLPSVRPDQDWSADLLEASVDVLLRGWLAEFSKAPWKVGKA
ncbi:MAG: TetR/AcrR family transcriptional regulator [Myxococcota bacterium]|jgi:AcrR family transcriptional regulator|nr:TetR/AcrR family transcriptional regulator [Myxococcota bacterium]